MSMFDTLGQAAVTTARFVIRAMNPSTKKDCLT